MTDSSDSNDIEPGAEVFGTPKADDWERLCIECLELGNSLVGRIADVPSSIVDDALFLNIENYCSQLDKLLATDADAAPSAMVQELLDLHPRLVVALGSHSESLKGKRESLHTRLKAVVKYLEQGLPAGLRGRRC